MVLKIFLFFITIQYLLIDISVSFVHFANWIVSFSLLNFESSFQSLCLAMWFATIFFPAVARFFILLAGISQSKRLNFEQVQLNLIYHFFSFYRFCFGVKTKNSWPSPRFQRFSPTCLPKSLNFACFLFKSIILSDSCIRCENQAGIEFLPWLSSCSCGVS